MCYINFATEVLHLDEAELKMLNKYYDLTRVCPWEMPSCFTTEQTIETLQRWITELLRFLIRGTDRSLDVFIKKMVKALTAHRDDILAL